MKKELKKVLKTLESQKLMICTVVLFGSGKGTGDLNWKFKKITAVILI